MVSFFAEDKISIFSAKNDGLSGVLAEIELILCGPFTPQWKVL